MSVPIRPNFSFCNNVLRDSLRRRPFPHRRTTHTSLLMAMDDAGRWLGRRCLATLTQGARRVGCSNRQERVIISKEATLRFGGDTRSLPSLRLSPYRDPPWSLRLPFQVEAAESCCVFVGDLSGPSIVLLFNLQDDTRHSPGTRIGVLRPVKDGDEEPKNSNLEVRGEKLLRQDPTAQGSWQPRKLARKAAEGICRDVRERHILQWVCSSFGDDEDQRMRTEVVV